MWTKVYVDLFQHPKLGRLCRQLPGMTEAAAVGHLVSLWTWAMSYAPDGSLAECDALDIAIAARYQGDPEAFQEALVKARWLDRSDGGALAIHDWGDYGGRYIDQREQARQKSAQWREDQKAQSKRARAANASTGDPAVMVAFHEQFWPVYPKKEAQGLAERAWAGMAPAPEQVEVIMHALKKQMESELWRTEPRWIPHASTWLEGKRWLDETREQRPANDPDEVVL